MACEEENKPQIDFRTFICFGEEANGNIMLYNKTSKEVMLFAPDHSFVNVEVWENQPEYTFYKIIGAKTFRDYVEKLASEWTNQIL
ncbi:MAG: hypothetical protein JNM36_17130 [Chitinophagales bacterium]|jgi:hypothetical protein|nr:hypothetical protein [Chitinophagales bacterium]